MMNRRQFLFRTIGTGASIAISTSALAPVFASQPTDTLSRIRLIWDEITNRGDTVLAFHIGDRAYDTMWDDIYRQMGLPPVVHHKDAETITRARFGEFEGRPVRHYPELSVDCIKVVAQRPSKAVYSEKRELS